MREIAKAAGVNYGLIYHYVGTKDDLLQLAFNTASDEYAEEFGRARTARDAAEFLMRSRNPEFVRMLARSLLEGRDVDFGQSPAMVELTRRIAEELPKTRELTDHDPRVIAAMLTTLSMGWTLFGDYVRTITGLSDAAGKDVKDIMDAIVLSNVELE